MSAALGLVHTLGACASDGVATSGSASVTSPPAPAQSIEPRSVDEEPASTAIDSRVAEQGEPTTGREDEGGSAWHQSVALRRRAKELREAIDGSLAERRARHAGIGDELLRSTAEMQAEIDAVDVRLGQLQDEMLNDPSMLASAELIQEINDLEVRLFRVRGLASVVFQEAK